MSQKELNISMVSMLIPSEVPSGSSPSPRACEQSCTRIISHWGCRAQCQGRPPVLTQLHCSASQIQFTHPLRNTPTRQSSMLAFLRSLERGLIGSPRKPKKHVEKQTVGRPSLRVPTAARGDVFAHFLMLQHERASQLGFIFRARWNSTDPPASCLPAEPFSHLVDDKASDGLH